MAQRRGRGRPPDVCGPADSITVAHRSTVRVAASYLTHWNAANIITIDVVRTFTTAAHAFEAGAREIQFVETIDDDYRALDRTRPVRPRRPGQRCLQRRNNATVFFTWGLSALAGAGAAAMMATWARCVQVREGLAGVGAVLDEHRSKAVHGVPTSPDRLGADEPGSLLDADGPAPSPRTRSTTPPASLDAGGVVRRMCARTTAAPGSDFPTAWLWRSRQRATARGLIASTVNPAAMRATTIKFLSVSIAAGN